MVGIQCKSCGHRALATPPGPFKMDHEIIALLRSPTSSITCIECGGSKFDLLSMSSSLADSWLGDGPSPGPRPLIEGGNQG